jgi:uncharacterized protein YxjI
MAHEFVILNTSGVTTTYTSYEAIPVDSTLKNVIKFVPDLGTLVDGNEVLIEDTPEVTTFSTNTVLILDSDGVIIEQIHGNTSSVGTDFVIKNSSDTVLITIKQSSSSGAFAPFPLKNSSGTTVSTLAFSLSSISSGSTFTKTIDTGFNDKLIPEDWTTSSENHLVLETSDDSIADNHYHPPTQDHHRVTPRDSSIMDILNSSGDVIHEIFGNITSSGSDFIIKNSSNTTLRTIKQTSSSSPSETFLLKNSSGTVITTLTFSSVEINSGTEILRDDDHTAEEHREIALWDYKLQVLMKQERENASSN